MVVDHIGFGLCHNEPWMRLVGRFSFPVYAFLFAECYYHVSRGDTGASAKSQSGAGTVKKSGRLTSHMIRYIVLLVVSEFAYDAFVFGVFPWTKRGMSEQSVMPTLVLGMLALIGIDRLKSLLMSRRRDLIEWVTLIVGGTILALVCGTLSYLALANYRFAGVLLIVGFYFVFHGLAETGKDLKGYVIRILICLLLMTVYWMVYIWTRSGFGTWSNISAAFSDKLSWMIPTILAAVPIALYNGREGRRSAGFDHFYRWFFPLQYVVLAFVRYVIL